MTVSTTAPTAVGQRDERVAPAAGASASARRVRGRRGLRPVHGVLIADVIGVGVAVLVLARSSRSAAMLALAVGLAWLFALACVRAYAPGLERTRPVLRAGAALGLGCCLLLPTVASLGGSTPGLLRLPALLTAGGLVTHVALPRLLGSWSRSHPRRQGLVVVGHRAQLDAAVAELSRSTHRAGEIVTVEVDETTDATDAAERVLQSVVEHEAAAVVALPGPGLGPASLRRLDWRLETGPTQLFIATGLLDVARGRTAPTALGGMRVIHLRPRDVGALRRLVKEAVERTVAATALVLLGPLLLAIALAVRIGSPGPAIFCQTRVGRDATEFTMYKFRTMHLDAERARTTLAEHNDCDGVLFKMRRDPRVTRVGRVLRRCSLDELPQLANVLLGQMSLVGPRPALPGEVRNYAEDPRRRLVVKPGLTGLWQVSGRSDLTWEESVRLDLHYVDNWSLALDAQIVLRTVGAVLNRRGAY